MGSLLEFAERFISALPSLLAAGKAGIDLATQFKSKFSDMKANSRAPTDEEWKWLNDSLDPLERKLQSDTE